MIQQAKQVEKYHSKAVLPYTSDHRRINLKDQDLVSIELFNVKGQISYSFNSLKFRLPNLNAGIYLVKVQYGRSVFVDKISIN